MLSKTSMWLPNSTERSRRQNCDLHEFRHGASVAACSVIGVPVVGLPWTATVPQQPGTGRLFFLNKLEIRRVSGIFFILVTSATSNLAKCSSLRRFSDGLISLVVHCEHLLLHLENCSGFEVNVPSSVFVDSHELADIISLRC